MTLDLEPIELSLLISHLRREDVMIPQLWSKPMASLQEKLAVLAQNAQEAQKNPPPPAPDKEPTP
jgi:hypothetical protein